MAKIGDFYIGGLVVNGSGINKSNESSKYPDYRFVKIFANWLFGAHRKTIYGSRNDSDDGEMLDFLIITFKAIGLLSIIVLFILLPITSLSIFPEILPEWISIEAKLDGQTLSGYVTGIFSISIALSGAFIAIRLAKAAENISKENEKSRITFEKSTLLNQERQQKHDLLRDSVDILEEEIQKSLSIISEFNKFFSRLENSFEMLRDLMSEKNKKQEIINSFYQQYCQSFLECAGVIESTVDNWRFIETYKKFMEENIGHPYDDDVRDISRRYRMMFTYIFSHHKNELNARYVVYSSMLMANYNNAYMIPVVKRLLGDRSSASLGEIDRDFNSLYASLGIENLSENIEYKRMFLKKSAEHELERLRIDGDYMSNIKAMNNEILDDIKNGKLRSDEILKESDLDKISSCFIRLI